MALTLIDPQNPLKSKHLIGQNYELVLDQSIEDLVNSQNSDISFSLSTLHQLIQARTNPPLETIWVYSALTFSNKFSANEKISDRVSALKDLFQLICSYSAPCSSSKSINLLAPVVYQVYNGIIELKNKGKELSAKREKKLTREIKSLMNSILGLISLCCGSDDESHLESDLDVFIRPLEDLISVWMRIVNGENLEEKEKFRMFFPILGDEIAGSLNEREFGVRELTGVVIAEAFLLRSCLDLCSGIPEMQLKSWAVGSITGFQNFHFFETLVRMLLEEHLPVTSLLSSEHEVTLRRVLYDAVILAGYTFLNPERVIHLSAKRVLNLSILRVLVTHEATELFRKKGDHAKALSYINAFSNSQLPSQLVKLVRMEIKADQPKGMSPKAILKWLLKAEDQGLGLMDESFSNLRSRLAPDISDAENEVSEYDKNGMNPGSDILFYIDNKGGGEGESEEDDDEGADEYINAAFFAAARAIKSAGGGGGERKRKGGKSLEKERQTRVKFQKYQLCDGAGEKSSAPGEEDSSSESQVENPISDGDLQ